MSTPEEAARRTIDAQLEAAGWLVQDRNRLILGDLANGLLDAVDPDAHLARARERTGRADPSPEEIAAARKELVAAATAPFDDAALRERLAAIHRRAEQILDGVSVDRVLAAGWSDDDTERARATVRSFERFVEEHRDEITALEIIYSQPYARQRLTYRQVKELAERLEMPPRAWTTEALWRAYAQLEWERVRGVGGQRVLTDLVSLVRHAVQLDDELEPYPDRVRRRYEDWLAVQERAGRRFSDEQRWWLDQIAAHIGVSLAVTVDDFDYGALFRRGGWIAARRLFGAELPALLEEMNEALTL